MFHVLSDTAARGLPANPGKRSWLSALHLPFMLLSWSHSSEGVNPARAMRARARRQRGHSLGEGVGKFGVFIGWFLLV